MAPTGTAGDGESPNSSMEQSGCVTQKECGTGTEREGWGDCGPLVLFNSPAPALLCRIPSGEP